MIKIEKQSRAFSYNFYISVFIFCIFSCFIFDDFGATRVVASTDFDNYYNYQMGNLDLQSTDGVHQFNTSKSQRSIGSGGEVTDPYKMCSSGLVSDCKQGLPTCKAFGLANGMTSSDGKYRCIDDGYLCDTTKGFCGFGGGGGSGGGGADRPWGDDLDDIKDKVQSNNDRISLLSTRVHDSETRLYRLEVALYDLVPKIDDLLKKYFDAGLYDSATHWSGDGDFTKLIKGQNTRLIKGIDDGIKKYFDAGLYDSSTYSSGDGFFTKLIKGQNTRLIKGIDSAADRIIKSLSSITGVTPPVTNDNPYKDILSKMDDLKKEISKISFGNQIINNEKGTTIWDFFNGVLDFLDSFLDKIIYLVVPEDTTFISNSMSNLSDTFKSKFEVTTQLKNMITTIFQIEERTIEFDAITLPAAGNVTLIDTSFINKFAPYFRNFLSGLLIIITTFWAYKKITTEMIR